MSSVNTDPVAGIRKAMVGRVFVASLQWDSRDHWLLPIDGKLIPVYDTASHKYWLRGLIRRCR